MSEWWTYRLSSFLMYSPRSYARMVELYGSELWPGPLIACALGLLALWLAARRTQASRRALAFLLALAWAWVGWAFHAQRYSTIFLGAPYLAIAFEVQAAILALAALAPAAPPRDTSRAARALGWVLAVAALLAFPLLALADRRPFTQAEVFGWTADPTALGTVGFLLLGGLRARPIPRALLFVVPIAACGTALLTLWALKTSRFGS